HKIILALDVLNDRFVHIIASYAGGLAGNDASERDYSNLRRTAADIYDHAAGRLPYRKIGADGRRERLFDRVGFTRPSLLRSILNRPLLNGRNAGRHADHDVRMALKQGTLLLSLANKIFNHRRSRVEVGDNAVLHRTDGADVAR